MIDESPRMDNIYSVNMILIKLMNYTIPGL